MDQRLGERRVGRNETTYKRTVWGELTLLKKIWLSEKCEKMKQKKIMNKN